MTAVAQFTLAVSKCNECPCWDDERSACSARFLLEQSDALPERPYDDNETETYGRGDPPGWCPLRTAPLLVQLAVAPIRAEKE